MDDTFNYLSKIDINSEDLEKRTLTSKLLITGRSLLNMAKKGLKMYKKALGYAAKKWNMAADWLQKSGRCLILSAAIMNYGRRASGR